MSYSYDRTKSAALHDGPVGRVLMKYWNELHDLQHDLEQANHEYDIAFSYRGGPGTKDSRDVMGAIDECLDLLGRLADAGGTFDKVVRAEANFVKKHGTPDDYAADQRARIYPH